MSTPEDVVLPDGRRIGDLKVADLRTQLEIRGLSRSGVKKDLCARLSGAVDGELRQERDKSEAFMKSVELDDFSDGTINVRNEDTLEIDAVASDEEISEVSTSVNICEVNMETSVSL
uniref:DNA-binding SAP,domain-containing protein n=1 Tax=Schistosoma japonicum TaxID=6182 RepID=C1LEI1_SCHJA|nr:DNA-binding SAP,domain-containing protein [Schistosoma japonicum]